MQPMRRWSVAGLLWLATMAAATEGRAGGTAPAPALLVSCVAAGPKVALPEGLCSQFVAALRRACPAREVRLAEGGDSAEASLVVERANSRMLVARIDWGGETGESRGMARADAPLDPAATEGFLDALIAASPGPACS